MTALWLLLLALVVGVAGALTVLRRKQAAHWLPAAVGHGVRQWFIRRPTPVHVLFAFVDHFEPSRGQAAPEVAAARLQAWLDRFPDLAERYHDSDGRPLRHTWFYPYDEWRDGEVAALGELCFAGYGEVELHLHHDGDTAAALRHRLEAAVAAFGRHGALLGAGTQPQPRYGFIHGNWCLDNSRPDGRWCGVNDELRVLAETGCYADFTLPTPDGSQPRRVNAIYRATDDPARPKSHDWGSPLVAGRRVPGDLLLIPGPLGVNLRDWHHRCYPAIERSDIAHASPVTATRVDFWVRCGVGVRGRPDWVFVKVHAHGCVERDQDDVLGDARHRLHRLLLERYGDGEHYALHHCTARELYNLARAAEDGVAGEPGSLRDYELAPPVNSVLRTTGPVAVTALSAEVGEVRNLTDDAISWRLRVGPVGGLTGAVRSLRWRGGEVEVDSFGEWHRAP